MRALKCDKTVWNKMISHFLSTISSKSWLSILHWTGLKHTWMMIEVYFLYNLFLDEMSTSKSQLSTVKWMESRCTMGVGVVVFFFFYHCKTKVWFFIVQTVRSFSFSRNAFLWFSCSSVTYRIFTNGFFLCDLSAGHFVKSVFILSLIGFLGFCVI